MSFSTALQKGITTSWISPIFAIAFVAVVVSGCSDPEGFVGAGALGDHLTAVPHEVTLYPDVDTLSWSEEPTGSSNYLHLGHASQAHSAILMKFSAFPALKDTFLLDSAVVTLRLNQVFRDSVMFHQGNIRLSWITDPWDESTVISDSLPDWGTYPALDTTWIVLPADSDSLVLRLPPDTVRSWIDGDSSNRGFVLEMTNEPGFILQYFASEASLANRPSMAIYYTWWDSTASGWQEYQSDTVAYPNHDAFIVSDELQITDDILMIGNGVGYRNLLRFNLADSLPIFGTSIHYAALTMHLNPDHPLNYRSVPSVVRQKLESASWLDDPLNPDISSAASQAILIGDSTLTVTLTLYVRDWVIDPSQNFGALIRSDNPGWDIAREVFYSRAAPDSALLPSLRIIYTVLE